MGHLQVRNLPDDLHAKLAARARSQGTNMSQYVTELIRGDLARPSMAEWLVTREKAWEGAPLRTIDTVAILDEVRDEREEHLLSVLRESHAMGKESPVTV
ncbi:MAG: hypothetical protein FWD59_09300 [Micrococcales bacterium]|nr:hypothetical protein [Micrococcales bacterium]